MTAHEVLALAIGDALDKGHMPPCADDPDLWTSDDRHERARAATLCQRTPCPVIAECHAAAEETDERFNVWAGLDRSPDPTRKKTP